MKRNFDNHIEALRGFAALSVLLFHLVVFSKHFNGGFDFKNKVINYEPPGHSWVLVFFIISGYVIGLNYADRTKQFSISEYLKKRMIRLYPIYLFSIIITVLLFKNTWQVIMGNLFFLQNLFTDCFDRNQSLWSLNHEMIYYLLAIPVIIFRINVKFIFPVLLIPLLFRFFIPLPAIVEYKTSIPSWMQSM